MQQAPAAKPAQRLAMKYRFDDEDMDLFFVAALGWGPAGGLDVGQAFHVASRIVDGDGDSWVRAFAAQGELLDAEADDWLARGARRNAGEARLKAFAAYRSSWQFASPRGAAFGASYAKHQRAFARAMDELQLPATFFQVPWEGASLPGVFLQNADRDAPVVLVIGGADTCFEDLFLTVGRNLLERGFSVAIADLPGQGNTAAQGLHWPVEAEKPIAAVTDLLVERFCARPGRLALLGLSLGGYFVARAAGHDTRFATVMASTPFPEPAQLFALSVQAGLAAAARPGAKPPTAATLRSRETMFWKVGAANLDELVARTAGMKADPSRVSVPFLSILGSGDSPVFAAQAHAWHAGIRSTNKRFVLLDAASGADGHVQVANRLRLAQECTAWMDDVFAAGR
ncbi:alpha/beta fold hydrolase [Scleromatobacter humisilvae]|uniref:Esterase FrsA n=1 Tax=Scleromatobacter humisilvae TaxID=2897159 RepID=A0A9X1YPI8_9BURK|nr:prolyl oligopeptidase family serine peptidase [Scleromatobacter humisilvae]MCK9688708.1 esterase FrsA [Scleromatobacter humisilvae]